MKAMKLEDGKYIMTVKNGLAEVNERVEEYNTKSSIPREGLELRAGDHVTFNPLIAVGEVRKYSLAEGWVYKNVKDISAKIRYSFDAPLKILRLYIRYCT